MTEEQLKELFKKAKEAVEELPDILKPVAFKFAVDQLSLNQAQQKGLAEPTLVISNQLNGDFFENMQIGTGIERAKLEAVYRINKDSLLKLIVPINGKPPEIQRYIALLYLLGNKIGLGKDWVSPFDLVNQIDEYGAKDRNISRNLKQEKSILQSGKSRGKEYGLSPNGVIKAKEVLSKFVE